MALEFLTQGTPASSNQNQVTQSTLPDWYNSYIQGIANKASSIASQPYQNYPGQQLADFNDTQRQAFDLVGSNVGNYMPYLNSAGNSFGQAGQYGAGATNAVGGPGQSWIDDGVMQKYMSPYTKSVVDEISRLGNQNLMESILPQVQSSFVGSGQFGSSRNADILGRSVRDAQTNISGLQSQALQSGYGTAANIFNQDALRDQAWKGLQAQTYLGAGNLANQTGAQQGALGQLRQSLGMGDVSALGAVGGQQQALEQSAYDRMLANFREQRDWDWTQLGRMQNAVSGIQLPQGQQTSSSGTSASAGSSPLAWLTAIGGLYKAVNP